MNKFREKIITKQIESNIYLIKQKRYYLIIFILSIITFFGQFSTYADNDSQSTQTQQKNIKMINEVLNQSQLAYDINSNFKNNIILSQNGKTKYKIFITAHASIQESEAARILAKYLKIITGAHFPIINIISEKDEYLIAVGSEAAITFIGDKLLLKKQLGDDGIVINITQRKIILTGGIGALRGTIYSVMTFLEAIGFRQWTENAFYAPSKPTLKIAPINITYIPPFSFREVYASHVLWTKETKWAVFNKLNGSAHKKGFPISIKLGGNITYTSPYFVHTFNMLVPHKTFFPLHPEWFAEQSGKRLDHDLAQWCLTNPDLLKYVINKVKNILKSSPGKTIISISQNDKSKLECQCKKCSAINTCEESQMGSLLTFINSVADAVKDEYPQAIIDTLAYRYTMMPPKNIKPHSNVAIRLCPTHSNIIRLLPLDKKLPNNQTKENDKFVIALKAWGNICKNLYVWDYICDFHNYFRIFPDFYSLAPNLRLYCQNNVKGIFLQGAGRSNHYTDFSELKTWVLAKLIWNPDLKTKPLVDEFIIGYYGDASPYILKYLDLLYQKDPLKRDYLTENFLIKANVFFTHARNAVANNPIILNRINRVYLSVLFETAEQWSFMQQKKNDGKLAFSHKRKWYVDEFVKICNENKIPYCNEEKITPKSWARKYKNISKIDIPSEFLHIAPNDRVGIQDINFKLFGIGTWADLKADQAASDKSAAMMPGNHTEWAIQAKLPVLSSSKSGINSWKVYVYCRVKNNNNNNGVAFRSGVYDLNGQKSDGKDIQVNVDEIKNNSYNCYYIATIKPGNKFIWVSPQKGTTDSIWVDRFYLIREKSIQNKRINKELKLNERF